MAKPDVPKVTVNVTTVVCVDIRGESRGEFRARDDGGFVSKFLDFQRDAGVFTTFGSLTCGGGAFHGYFTVEDAEKVKAWLKEQGVEIG